MTHRRSLWLMRLYYLLSTGAGGFLFPFITLFYQQQGLSGAQMGWLSTTASLVALISAPLIGRLTDNFPQPRRVLQFCLLGSGVLMLALSQQKVFGWMALIIGLEAIIGAPVFALSDAQAMRIANEESGFGSIRLWGSLGWAVTAFVGGWLVAKAGLVTVFVGYALLYFACLLVLEGLVFPDKPVHHSEREKERPSIRAVLSSLTQSRVLVGLAIALALLWLSNNGRHQFETLYMKELGASEEMIGWASTYPALLELPLMLWTDRLVRRYGAGKTLFFSLVVEAAALLAIVFAPGLPAVLLMRALSGMYYSFYAIASVAYATEHTPAGQSSTILSLYYVTLYGVINLITAPLSGVLYDRLGAYPLFVLAAVGTILSGLVLLVSQRGAKNKSGV